MIDKIQKREAIVSAMRYQVPHFPSTFSACPDIDEPGDHRAGRGGRRCLKCLTRDLGENIGDAGLAEEFAEKLVAYHHALSDVLYGKRDDWI